MNININGIFNPENRFWSFMNKIMDVCFISVLWLIFSLPVVTVGAATASLFQFTLKLTADEEGYVWRSFIKGFSGNFIQATVLWIAAALVGGFLVADLYFCQFLGVPKAVKTALFIALLSILIVYLLTIIFLFPLIAYFKVNIKKAVTNSCIMAVGNLHITFTILVIYGISLAASYFMPVLFMVWFGLAAFVSSYFYRFVFHKYMEEEKEPGAIDE